MAIQNTLNYLLLTEYLNPNTLKDIQKSQTKTKVVFEMNVHEFDEKFWQFFALLKDEIYRLNKADRSGKCPTLKVEIYGGVYETSLIQDVICQKYPELKNDEFKQSSLAYAASYYYMLDGDFTFKDSERYYVLKDNLELNDKSLKPVCCGETGYNIGELFLSTVPWACENFTNAKNLNYENFKEIKQSLQNDISAFLPHEISIAQLIASLHELIKNRLKSKIITDKLHIALSLESPDTVLLNSFYIEDISKILSTNDINKSLEQILDENDPDSFKRIDTREYENLPFLIEKLGKNSFTLGAFASEYMLIFSQQIAVNEIMKLFSKDSGGIYSVNGPPGTGKTTLLKDIIAAVIVERAIQIADTDADIFEKGIKLSQDSKYPDFYPLKQSLKGFEIVVTSSNNKAVENISQELPRLDSVAKEYLDELEYFRNFATRLLSSNAKSSIANPAWGLISASLGKSSNVNKFKSNCLLKAEIDKTDSDFAKLKEMDFVDEFNDKYYIKGLISYLHEPITTDFKQAKAEFLDAIKQAKHENEKAFAEFEKLKNEYENLVKFENLNIGAKIKAQDDLLINLSDKLNTLLEPTKVVLQELQDTKTMPQEPGIFAKILKTQAYKNYIIECENIAKTNELINATNAQISAQNSKILSKYDDDLKHFNKLKNDLPLQINEANLKLNELKTIQQNLNNLNNIKEKLNQYINLDDRHIRENSSPFMAINGKKTDLAKARINVFIKALMLHRSCILQNKSKFVANLKMFESKDLTTLDKQQRLNILQSLFMIVPVISTTFASMSRFFDKYGVGKNDIAMMLVDESGQANISNAVGALWRAKNAVIVGDPLQLEPVVTLPSSLNEVLLRQNDTKNEFNVATTSLQARADKVQNLGAYIGDTWVGSPLIVHRRCDEPMFGVANDTTYDGAMIWGRKSNAGFLGDFGVKSSWIDVRGSFVGNSCKEELEAADKLYEELKIKIDEYNKKADLHNQTHQHKMALLDAKKDIQVITPFTDIVRASRSHKCHANTIHTMQGQEASIIIFILGGGSAGARAWASAKPNLLNVALTRAKHYIYIIGDKAAWSELKYFSVAASRI
ncbi:DEAD/DEAH box helicase [Campylobacter suis]|uniref:DNA2/NAM7 helicase-like C-terminal domain-containing protein n=1 Tax=Campylobacter suis TaxID=2790657 RepID=A0ABM8Q8D0_9BACT|nr:AAA domain-containing protein [Campylobacter suis]CAD7289041.1 hypothetical protein LMG8286_01626 [Campylobacter suis]